MNACSIYLVLHRPLTETEIRERREEARQRHQARMAAVEESDSAENSKPQGCVFISGVLCVTFHSFHSTTCS